jgi:dolichol-phosphate mannosyltransferase
MNSKPKVHVLLPAYNEEKGLAEFLESILKIFQERNYRYQIIVCNDGSKDNTREILQNISKKNENIIILEHKINRGLGEAIRTLFEYVVEHSSDEDYVIRMDCDATHEAEYLDKIIDELRCGNDVVIASRFKKGGGQIGVPNSRIVLSKLANLAFSIFFPTQNRIKEFTSGYRGYSASILKKAVLIYGNDLIQLKNMGFACTVEKLVKLDLIGAQIVEVPFVLRYDKKLNDSKMVTNITTYGYLIMILLYHWPRSGWKKVFKVKG